MARDRSAMAPILSITSRLVVGKLIYHFLLLFNFFSPFLYLYIACQYYCTNSFKEYNVAFCCYILKRVAWQLNSSECDECLHVVSSPSSSQPRLIYWGQLNHVITHHHLSLSTSIWCWGIMCFIEKQPMTLENTKKNSNRGATQIM